MTHKWILSALFLMLLSLATAQTKSDSLILIERFSFHYRSNHHQLNERHDSLLAHFFTTQRIEELEFHIDAYTDSDGGLEFNQELSNQRTMAIVSWLRNHSVDSSKIYSKGHGEYYSDSTGNEKDKAKDRRSDVRIYQRTPYKTFRGILDYDQTEELEGVEISIFDNGIKRKVIISEGSEFEFPVPLERSVELHFEAKDHFPVVRNVKLSQKSKVDHVVLPIVRMKDEAVANINVQFFGGRSIILPNYMSSLGTLASVIHKSPQVCIELAGHINQPGDIIFKKSHRSYGLSIARAIVVHDYLIESGIHQDRLLARGYSNSQMKYPNARTEDQASANRRVEARVVSCDSTRIISNDFFDDIGQFRPIR